MEKREAGEESLSNAGAANKNHIRWFSLVRIAGLAMVLFYHFFRDFMPGGFLGVDVFFTFSGYLITSLIVAEYDRRGNFRLLHYIKRRFLRIFPPLLLSVVITLPAALLIAPDFTGGIGRQISGALGFVTNYFEILGGGSYEAQLLPHLYVHTWSLALEMHYYLLWGLLCAGLIFLTWAAIPDDKKRRRALRVVLVVLSLSLAALCFWRMRALYTVSAAAAPDAVDPSRAYFDSTSHAFPFFIGSALGALFGMKLDTRISALLRRKAREFFLPLLATIGCCVIALFVMGFVFHFDRPGAYRFGFLLASLVTGLLICAIRALHEGAPPHLKEPRAMTILADLSYSVYLFHWPLYIVFSETLKWNWLAALLTAVLSFFFAAIVYYGVEPLLRGKRPWQENRLVMLFYPAVAVLLLACLAGSAAVFARAPVVTQMEQTLLDGKLYQSGEDMAALHQQAAAVNPSPVEQNRVLILTYPDATAYEANESWTPSVPPASIGGGVTFIGDSVSLGANRLLTQTIPGLHADSKESRNMAAGLELLKTLAANGDLEEYVVISLGTNGYGAWQNQVDGMVAALPAGRKLIFVTPFIGKPRKGLAFAEIAAYYRALPEQYPFITVADWAEAIGQRQELLAADKIHFGKVQQCSQMYVDLILEALSEAKGKPGK
ncbi:MAG: acyltransferase [Oscillospiraceae bacterium]|jgi:peptidoglycan/LPS O-acetylase OafA/YrhL|nr:acyltransferase [Oscillospiraceae bacterium]